MKLLLYVAICLSSTACASPGGILGELLRSLKAVEQKKVRYDNKAAALAEEGRIGGGRGAMAHRIWSSNCVEQARQLKLQIARVHAGRE